MKKERRSARVSGLILVLLGIVFLAEQIWPGLFLGSFTWPWIIIAIGGIFLLTALLTGEGAFAIPGSIVGGIGTLLLWQNTTGNWDSWAYAWTLIPGFVGVGILLAGLLGHERKGSITGGLLMIGLSAGAFLLFGGLFTFNGWYLLRFWPVILIVLGIGMLARGFFRPA
jgi:hypothetical protein